MFALLHLLGIFVIDLYKSRRRQSPRFHRVTGGLEITAGLLLLIPATSRAGAIGSVVILLAAVMTLIRYRDWTHLPGAVVLTAVAVAAATIRG